MPPDPSDALKAWFLGPRAENAELLERLVVESLRDHVFWRRNYHPEDGVVIRETDKRQPGYEEAVGTLTQELMGLLAELKRDVPIFSGRYKGHMIGEQTIASQVGYVATMLYNPNNIASEIAPVTTRLELEVAAQLARMIGYDPERHWGHITSGGTLANFEALWLARGVRYLAVAAAGAADELGLDLSVTRRSLWELLNVPGQATLDLWDELWRAAPRDDVRRAVANHSLAAIGYQEYSRRLALDYGDPLPAGVVLVAATAHYSWEKIVRALGIGSNQLIYVPVDAHYRMDPDALWERVRGLARHRQAVLACVSVCGSTGIDWPSEAWVHSIEALGQADSVAIDPHKMGYVPYSAGAILVRDGRARQLVAVDPPYLSPGETGEDETERFLGRYILEGSKPGASAAAVWLSHKVLPLDQRGYGYLVERSAVGARALHAALKAADLAPFRTVMLPLPDINIVCWLVAHPALTTLAAVNDLNEGIYRRMSLAGSDRPEYIITRTRLRSPMYDGAVDPLLAELRVCTPDEWRAAGAAGLVVLRSTVMDPFLATTPSGRNHLSGFVAALGRACRGALAD